MPSRGLEDRPKSVESARKVLTKILDKVAEMKDSKPWITEEEKKDVTEKLEEVKKWLEETLAAQGKLGKHEDPVFKPADVNKKLSNLQKLYSKVAKKQKPKEKKPKKEDKGNSTEGEEPTSGSDEKKEEEKKEDTKDQSKEESKEEEETKEEKSDL